jgi:hypothetical protein
MPYPIVFSLSPYILKKVILAFTVNNKREKLDENYAHMRKHCPDKQYVTSGNATQ